MNQFDGTATYYSQFRPGIPDDVARVLIDVVSDEPHHTLLDLGTGTGQVIQALHPYFGDIIGVDPDREMLDLAEKTLRPVVSHDTGLVLSCASAEDVDLPAGWRASLVTICRAFHWMDQPAVLRRLEPYMHQHGAVAVLGDSSFWEANSTWKQAVRDVIQEFLGERRRAGSGTFTHHNRPYTEILAESPFNQVEEIRVPVHRTWTAEGILGYLYSTSFAARPLFGDQLDAFEDRVRHVLAGFSAEGVFAEENEFLIRVGRKGA